MTPTDWAAQAAWSETLRRHAERRDNPRPRKARSSKSAQETAPQLSAAVSAAVSLAPSPTNQLALAAGQSD